MTMYSLAKVLRFIASHPLNADRVLISLIKFFWWQISGRLIGGRRQIPWVDDAKLEIKIGEAGLTGNIYCGLMEYQEMLFVLHALRPEDVFLDVGANAGAYTVLASGVVGATSIAFEPIAGTVERLTSQIQLNHIESVASVLNVGVGSARGTLLFTNKHDTVNRVARTGQLESTVSVEVLALDECTLPPGDVVIKIDVEGYECEVLKGASRVLSSGRVKALVVELNESGETFGYSNEDAHQILVGHGLVPIAYDPIARQMEVLATYNRRAGNTIYVRDVSEARALVTAAPYRTVHTAFGRRL